MDSKRTKIKTLLENGADLVGKEVVAKGWVRTKRGNKNVNFIALNDGSTINNIQIVIEVASFDAAILDKVTTGASIAVRGTLVESPGAGQSTEIQGAEIFVYGEADAEKYPLQKKGHSLEFLREIAHLRPRTNTFGAVMRIRHAMAYAVHHFFNQKGFFYINTPIITGSDAEGAGEMFKVTTLDLENTPKTKEGAIDFEQDFFGKETNLTVSGQLEAELAALALSEVYTFGPTFRAENSNTTRHLAEFWMIEPEVAFADINDNMGLAQEFLQFLVKYALENCKDDLEFLNKMYDKELLDRLKFVVENDFERKSYSEAVEILVQHNDKFEYKVEWGKDLQSEHERFLVEKHFKKPVVIYDYPKGIKAFYMRLNDDQKTVAAMDVLFPGIGEIIGGSQREERLEVLEQRIEEMNIPKEHVWWYLETRKYGTVPHAGFGLGFERLILFVTGMTNIRDVIPFPRTPKNAEF